MAEAILNREGKGRFRAFSAGSQPADALNPHTVAVLTALSYDIKAFHPKSWDEFGAAGAPVMDFIFTVCDDAAGETCPVWPGHPATSHWSIPDPAKVTGTHAEVSEVFDETYRQLATRIAAFVSLPIDKLDHSSLHHHLAEISKTGQGSAAA